MIVILILVRECPFADEYEAIHMVFILERTHQYYMFLPDQTEGIGRFAAAVSFLCSIIICFMTLASCAGEGGRSGETGDTDGSVVSQPVTMEYLDRGAVAAPTKEGIFLSWRLLGTEPYETSFSISRNSDLIAVVTDTTNYLDPDGRPEDIYCIQPVPAREDPGEDGVDAYRLVDKRLVHEASFDTSELGMSEYEGQGNHNLAVADVDGDGREEIVVRSDDGKSLLIYTTTIPAEHKLYTLMHDRTYRMQAAAQNAGYNQPPHLGYYVSDSADGPDLRRDACRIRTTKTFAGD